MAQSYTCGRETPYRDVEMGGEGMWLPWEQAGGGEAT